MAVIKVKKGGRVCMANVLTRALGYVVGFIIAEIIVALFKKKYEL